MEKTTLPTTPLHSENEDIVLRIEVPEILEIIAKRNDNCSTFSIRFECEPGAEYEVLEQLNPILKSNLLKKKFDTEIQRFAEEIRGSY